MNDLFYYPEHPETAALLGSLPADSSALFEQYEGVARTAANEPFEAVFDDAVDGTCENLYAIPA